LNLSEVASYIRAIASFEHIGIYTKLDELKRTKEKWQIASVSVRETCREYQIPKLLPNPTGGSV